MWSEQPDTSIVMSSSSCYSEEGFLGSVRYLLGRQMGEGMLGLRLRPRYSLQDLQGNGRCVQKHVQNGQNQSLEFKPGFSHVLSPQTPSLFCLMYKQGEQLRLDLYSHLLLQLPNINHVTDFPIVLVR